MKPVRHESDIQRTVSDSVEYMREWFGVPAPDWEKKDVDGTEKIYLVQQNDTSQLTLPFDCSSESYVDSELDHKNVDYFIRATGLMIDRLNGSEIDNPSREYIAAIGYRAAVTAMQDTTQIVNERIA